MFQFSQLTPEIFTTEKREGAGAHPVEGHRIDDHFMIGVSFARAINPISKTTLGKARAFNPTFRRTLRTHLKGRRSGEK
jgi:hypothetical protein